MRQRTTLHRISTVHGPALGDARAYDDDALLEVTEAHQHVTREPGTVGRCMSNDVVCVRPEVSVELVAAILLRGDIGAIPVVDDDRRLLGVVSAIDFVRAYADGRLLGELDSFDVDLPRPAHTAAGVMAPATPLHPRDRVADVAARFVRERIRRAPVVGDDGRVIGMVSALDLLDAHGEAPEHHAEVG